jgi:hypothetical protein
MIKVKSTRSCDCTHGNPCTSNPRFSPTDLLVTHNVARKSSHPLFLSSSHFCPMIYQLKGI